MTASMLMGAIAKKHTAKSAFPGKMGMLDELIEADCNGNIKDEFVQSIGKKMLSSLFSENNH